MADQQERGAEIIRDFGRVKGLRTNWESHWQEIAERIWPSMSGMFYDNGAGTTPGAKKTELMFDSTASVALGRFASVVDSLLTPQTAKWQKLIASNRDLMKVRAVRAWFEIATNTLFQHRYGPKSGFVGQNHVNFRMLGAFGTGTMFTDQLATEPGLRYKSVHLGEIYFAENHQGIIDRAWRRFPLTRRQAKQKFGDGLPSQIKSGANDHEVFWFIHCVKPREDIQMERADYRGMAFASYYVSETGQSLVQEGGYTSFPFAIMRYWQGPGEAYGRSPGMEVLPAIKTLNEEKKVILKQGHRTVDPVLLFHDDGIIDGFSLKPGAMNAGGVNAQGQLLVQTLPTGNLAITKELMDDERIVINDAFLTSIFQILVETPQMTATEVLERTREKGMLLTPTVGRQQSEYLGPLTERELDVLSRQGILPPMPGELIEAKGEYSIEYDSPLSRAMRAEEAAGIMRSLQGTIEIVNITQNPEPLDHYNFDVIIPETAEIQGAPLRWMNSPEVVKAKREARAAQVQQQTEIQAMPGMAAMVKAGAVAAKTGGTPQ